MAAAGVRMTALNSRRLRRPGYPAERRAPYEYAQVMAWIGACYTVVLYAFEDRYNLPKTMRRMSGSPHQLDETGNNLLRRHLVWRILRPWSSGGHNQRSGEGMVKTLVFVAA
jgi:hypothetical protein